MFKLNRENESGRSMVEMLGVLAIVGVLSAMGIAGYTVAMNSHRANEALEQASRYAMIISAQRQLNKGIVGVPATDSNGPYNFTLTDDASKIVMTADVKSVAVASRLVSMNLSMPTISVNGTTATFVFGNDLSEVGVCQNGNVYLSYNEGAECSTETPMNQETSNCWCTGEDGKCRSFEFDASWNQICPTTATLCTSNKDCATGEYCSIFGAGANPKGGTCMSLTEGVPYTYNNKSFLRSDNTMMWWSAENWCRAKGKSLVSLASISINKNNLGAAFDNEAYGNHDCWGDGENKCENVDWDAINAVFSGVESYCWTRDNYSSSKAYVVFFDLKRVQTANREGVGAPGFALCE